MRTAFSPKQLADPHMREAEHALRTCVHCGFCTATCPTYLLLGDERDLPRGRIALMQNMLESEVPPTPDTVLHIDRCLSCLGCKTACPSGVDYAALVDTARAHIEKTYRRPVPDRALRGLLVAVLMRPRLFAFALGLARLFAPLACRLPGRLGAMAHKMPPLRHTNRESAVSVPKPQRRVALLEGCVQRVLAPGIDEAAARVLARQDIGLTPLAAGCCGALAYHLGKVEIAKASARRVIAAFEQAPAEAVLITATGCSAFLKDYGRVFADDPVWQGRAKTFAARVKDFVELAAPPQTPMQGETVTLAYHPPCSLQHAQRLHGRGEALLEKAGFRLAPIPDAHLCCGSAGSYSLLQPEIAGLLRARKLAAIKSTGATMIASGNIGCLTQLSGADSLPTAHIAELLDWATSGRKPAS